MLEVNSYGEGTNVVLLHGCPVPPESVRDIRDRLQESYRVVVPNLTGINLDMKDSRAAIEEALLANGVEKAALVGHSLGAYRAFQLALSGVVEVTKVVALGPVVNYTDASLAQYGELADGIEAGAINVAEVALPLWYSESFLEANPNKESTVRRWFDEMGDQVVIDSLRVEFQGPDLHPLLHQVDLPVYIRVGELDAATPPEFSEAIAAHLPDVRLDIVPDVGHFLHEEDREPTLLAVESFLAGE